MKIVKTVFECDQCKAKIEREEARDIPVFPYTEGWIYLYAFNLQLRNLPMDGEIGRVERRDLHFCSKKCMLEYLGGLLG